MFLRRFLGIAAIACVSALAVACDDDDNIEAIDGTLRADGYALFSVDNSRQQRNSVTATVGNVTPGQTYVLLYSREAPKNVGWFLFDPSTRSRCGGSVGDHCKVNGYGWMVDTVTVPDAATEIVLRDEQCGCDADRDDDDWTGHWAVMRIERGDSTTPESPIHFEVRPRKVEAFTVEPDITQLQ